MPGSVLEPDAAAFLNLTVRTLRKYRASGQLPFREIPGKTRPVIAYQQRDLDRLKATLDTRRRRSKKPSPGQPGLPRVSFSLPAGEHAELSAEARQYAQAAGEYARRLVRERQESRLRAEMADLRTQLEAATAQLRTLRREVALGFEAVLEFVGLSPEDAKHWVDDNLR